MPILLKAKIDCEIENSSKLSMQNVLDTITNGRRRIEITEWRDSTRASLHYNEYSNEVFIVRIDSISDTKYNITIYSIKTEKELSRILSSLRSILNMGKSTDIIPHLKEYLLLRLHEDSVKLSKQ